MARLVTVFRWVEHTAELELEIDAASEREVFEQALAALSELLAGEDRRGGAPAASEHRHAAPAASEHRRVSASAGDRPALLAAWLEELVFLAEVEGFVPVALEALELRGGAVDATVAGRLGDPPPLIKAITYHRLAFAPAPGGYRATVVLDV
jgi:SHS2 domain-containing protein